LIDGSDIESGPITHQTKIRIHAANHTEEITFEETTLGGFPIILGLPWLKKHNPEIGWKTHEIRFNSEYCQNNCMNVGTTVEDITDEEAFIQKQLRPEDISLISATAFKRAARLGIAGSVSIREIDEELKLYATDKYEYMRKNQQETKKLSVEEIVPTEYHDFLDLFDEKGSTKLPPRRKVDHKINLIPGGTPPFKVLYGLSEKELEILKDYLETNMKM